MWNVIFFGLIYTFMGVMCNMVSECSLNQGKKFHILNSENLKSAT